MYGTHMCVQYLHTYVHVIMYNAARDSFLRHVSIFYRVHYILTVTPVACVLIPLIVVLVGNHLVSLIAVIYIISMHTRVDGTDTKSTL